MKLATNIFFFGVALGLVACQTPPQVTKQEMPPLASSKPAQDMAKTEAAKPVEAPKPSILKAPTADEIKVFTRNYDQDAWRLVVEQGAGWDIESLESDVRVMFGIAKARSALVNEQNELLVELMTKYPESLAVKYALSRVLRDQGAGIYFQLLQQVAFESPATTRLDKQVRAYALITMLDTDKKAFKEGMVQILDIYYKGDRSPWTLYFYGSGLAQLEQYEEALPLLKLAVTIQPDHINSLIALTSVLNDLGRFQESMQVNKEALKLKSDTGDRIQLLNNMGATHMDLRQWREAESALLESIRLNPGFIMGRINLAETQMQLGKRKEAFVNAGTVTTSVPSFSYGWAVLAWMYEKTGQTTLREAALAKLRGLEPTEAAKLIKVKFDMYKYRHDK